MESAAISKDIQRLESELSEFRTRVDQDSSLYASLERQIVTLKERLGETQKELRSHEAELLERRAELEEAQRLERLNAYEQELAGYREARDRVGKAADTFLAELEAYDGEVIRIKKLRGEMLDAFGSDERVGKVDAELDEDANGLTKAWKAVVGAAEWRLRAAEKAAAAKAKPPENGAPSPPADAKRDEGRTARILEYFNKS